MKKMLFCLAACLLSCMNMEAQVADSLYVDIPQGVSTNGVSVLDGSLAPQPKLYIPNVLYLQNMTINGVITYTAYTIMVGDHVTSSQLPGSVTFSGGQVTLKGDDVILQDNVLVQTGATLLITPL